jgi:hypothetical protein
MQNVKVRKTGISAEDAAEVIRRGLGEGYRVEPSGGAEVLVRKGTFGRAKVHLREEPGGTMFEVHGQGYPFAVRIANSYGIAKRVATAISETAEYRDDS